MYLNNRVVFSEKKSLTILYLLFVQKFVYLLISLRIT